MHSSSIFLEKLYHLSSLLNLQILDKLNSLSFRKLLYLFFAVFYKSYCHFWNKQSRNGITRSDKNSWIFFVSYGHTSRRIVVCRPSISPITSIRYQYCNTTYVFQRQLAESEPKWRNWNL